MTDINTAILKSLSFGAKTRAQLAIELNQPPPAVAGALVRLQGAGKITVSGNAIVNRKPVSMYALADGSPVPKSRKTKQAVAPAVQCKPLTKAALAEMLDSNLYQIWGGFAAVDQAASKKLHVTRYSES